MSKVNVFCILTSVLAMLSAYGNPSLASSGYPYWPLTSGSWIKYNVYKISARWDRESMKLSVKSKAFDRTNLMKVDLTTCNDCWGSATLFRDNYCMDINDPPISACGISLVEGGGNVNGKWYLGEAVNSNGTVHRPFIAKLTRFPVAGELLDVVSTVTKAACTDSCKIGTDFHWKYKTIEKHDTWGKYQDVWRTGLIEYQPLNDLPYHAYNYIFMKDVGLVSFWHVEGLDSRGYGGGELWVAVAWGGI